MPAINQSLSQLSATAASLSGAVSNQELLVDQTSLVLDQLASTLYTAKEALGQTDGLLESLEAGPWTPCVRTCVALGESDALAQAGRARTAWTRPR